MKTCTVPSLRDASTSVFREVETSAYELTKWYQTAVSSRFPLAKTLVPVHVERPTCKCMKNVTVVNSMYKNGTKIPYIAYVAQQHEEGGVICQWLAVVTASVSCKI